MKSKLLLFVFILSAFMINAQGYVYCDFETKDLNFATNNNLTYEVVANPVSGGINTSANCGKVVSAGGQWELIYSTPISEFIDFDEGKIFKMKVYSPRVGVPIYFKVEGGAPAKEVSSVVTTKANEWEELTFDFTSLSPQAMAYNKFVLLFDAGQTGSGETFYFDDIVGPNTRVVHIPETQFVTYCDFDEITLSFEQRNTSGDMQYEVVANPAPDWNNSSANCGKIVTTADKYELIKSVPIPTPFDFQEYGYKFKMKVLAPQVGDVYFKVENENGTVNKEVKLYCPVAGAWHELEFDFSDLLPASGVMNTLVILFDANSEVEGDVWYFDDIMGPGDPLSVGIDKVKYDLVDNLIYPNPVQNIINFNEPLQNQNVSIISISGSTLFSKNITGNSIDISNLNLSAGTYFIVVDDKVTRFMKN